MRLRLVLLALAAALATIAAASAEKPGRASAAAGTAPARIPALPATSRGASGCPIPQAYRHAFLGASIDTGLPLGLLVAVAQVESNFRADARSGAEARGLLQVLPATAATLRLDVDVPRTNVLAGARYLRILLDRFHSTDLALAAYNAGPTAVAAAGGAPSWQTLVYVAEVTRRWRALVRCNALAA